MKSEKAAPEHGWAGRAIMFATEMTAEPSHPGDSFAQCRHVVWRRPGAVNAAVQGLPFEGGQHHLARQIAIEASQHGGVENAPGDDRDHPGTEQTVAEQGGGPGEALAGLRRAAGGR